MIMDNIQREIIDSNICVTLDDERRAAYAAYLNVRVIRALWEVSNQEEPGSVTWDTCVGVLAVSRRFRVAAVEVLRKTVTELAAQGRFRFGTPEPAPQGDPEKQETLRSVDLLSREDGMSVVDWLFIQAEIRHYRTLQAAEESLTWREYVDRLLQKGDLWDQLSGGFQETLTSLDFKPAWLAQDWDWLGADEGTAD